MKCIYCSKPIVPIANKRKNGTVNHLDWDNREAHKKCWKDFVYIKVHLPNIKPKFLDINKK